MRTWAAMFSLYRRDVQEAQHHAEAVMALATEQGYPQWVAEATVIRGWALSQQGQPELGLALICQGQAAYQATGTQVLAPQYLTLRAEIHASLGQPDAGLTLLDEALSLADSLGARTELAEIYRLKGELLLQQSADHAAAAATCFQQALDLARRQQAKIWELRAATSLAACGSTRAKVKRPIRCWRQCMDGSQQALTRLTCRRPRHY
jgi:predicted ATPase